MTNYQISEGAEYTRGSSDLPTWGSKFASFVAVSQLQTLAEAVNSLRVLNPNTYEFDREKTNAARRRFIEEKTKPVSRDQTGTYHRRVFIDSDGLVNLLFE
ncbi:MAG: hypothetical protein WAT23_02355 [Chromatiaceae bacterium]